VARTPSGTLFPTDAPVVGDGLIGRHEAVGSLADQLDGHLHRVVAGPRRTGKTSVCLAALDELVARGTYVVAVDLFGVASLAELAEVIARGAVANRSGTARTLDRVRRLGTSLASAASITVTAALRAELGEEIEIAVRPGVAAEDPERAFRYALQLLQRIAEADDRRLVLFVDEVQELGDRQPFGDPDRTTKQMRTVLQSSDRVTCLFAGSIEHLVRDLFTPRQRAFYRFGGFFDLAPIDRADWISGLEARFRLDGCTTTAAALERLVDLGEDHPRATMLLAQQTHAASLAAQTKRIDEGLVGQGLALALAVDAAGLDGDVERIRALGRYAFLVARRVARGEPPYADLAPSTANRTLHALRDAGIVAQEGRGMWRMVDPFLRRHLVATRA
jgi:hypothetical protein